MDKELLRIERARIEWSGSNWQGRANQLPQSNEAQETDGVLWELWTHTQRERMPLLYRVGPVAAKYTGGLYVSRDDT